MGDNLLASGFAKGAKARGKRIAFGDGKLITWDHHSEIVFRNNPNIAPPGSERHQDIEWLPFYRGSRIYNRQSGNRWIWNYEFKAIPGEIYLTEDELNWGKQFGSSFVVIEPNVPTFKTVSPNKQWPEQRYRELAKSLSVEGFDVVQFNSGGKIVLQHARQIKTPTFRHALSVLKNAQLYIGPEGGLHHGAACVGIPAVVLFGGFIPPAVTGYDFHTNLTGGAVACGSLVKCEHCREAMNSISVVQVMNAANSYLKVAA